MDVKFDIALSISRYSDDYDKKKKKKKTAIICSLFESSS